MAMPTNTAALQLTTAPVGSPVWLIPVIVGAAVVLLACVGIAVVIACRARNNADVNDNVPMTRTSNRCLQRNLLTLIATAAHGGQPAVDDTYYALAGSNEMQSARFESSGADNEPRYADPIRKQSHHADPTSNRKEPHDVRVLLLLFHLH